jgi:uncharacterized membrane protein YkvA (DUF1232 family)
LVDFSAEDLAMGKRLLLLWTLVRGDAQRLWRALRHPASPLWLKWAVAGLALYLVSPVDLLPDFIPLLGLVDDLVLIPLVIRALLNRLPPHVKADVDGRTVNA